MSKVYEQENMYKKTILQYVITQSLYHAEMFAVKKRKHTHILKYP